MQQHDETSRRRPARTVKSEEARVAAIEDLGIRDGKHRPGASTGEPLTQRPSAEKRLHVGMPEHPRRSEIRAEGVQRRVHDSRLPAQLPALDNSWLKEKISGSDPWPPNNYNKNKAADLDPSP